MKDLKLDFINKIVINEYVDKADRVKQQIRLAINTWLGDWFIDETFGIDYDSAWANQELMENYVKEQIKQVSGIKSIKSFIIQKIVSNNYVYFQIDTTVIYNGDVLEISDTVGY